MLAGEETSEMPRIVDRPGLQTLLAVYIGICEAQKGKEVCPEADSCLDSASWLFGFSKSDTPPMSLLNWCVGVSLPLYVLNLLLFIYLKRGLI